MKPVKPSVFICHAVGDSDVARGLAASLRAAGVAAGLELPPGDNVQRRLADAIRAASALVLVVGPERGREVEAQWAEALEAVWADPTKPLIVLAKGGAQPPPAFRLLPTFRIAGEETAGAEWERIVKAMAKVAGKKTRSMPAVKGMVEISGGSVFGQLAGVNTGSVVQNAVEDWKDRLHQIEVEARGVERWWDGSTVGGGAGPKGDSESWAWRLRRRQTRDAPSSSVAHTCPGP